MLIKKYALRTELLVASPMVDDWYRQHEQEFSFAACEMADDKGSQRHGSDRDFCEGNLKARIVNVVRIFVRYLWLILHKYS